MDAAVRVQAYRIAEHKDVRLPIMICQDGFITSHAVENIELLEDDIVKTFVGEYEPEHYLLKDNEPFAVGPYAVTNYVMEAKRAQMQGLRNAKQVTLDVAKEFEKISGRSYGLFEEYRMEDADYAMVIIGSAAGTGKDTIDMLRKQGVRAKPHYKFTYRRTFTWIPQNLMCAMVASSKSRAAIISSSPSFSASLWPLSSLCRS